MENFRYCKKPLGKQASINVFTKFNELRNKYSFSHPNPILEKIEAEYAVKTISNTLVFLEKIENA